MQDIAEDLRHRREELGKSLEDAQTATKIRLRYLEALEAAEPGQIPGEVYVKGFLRSYGDYLGLDGWALVERYKAWRRAAASQAETEPQEASEETPPPPPPAPRFAPRVHALFQRPQRSGQRSPLGVADLALRIGVSMLVLVVGFSVWAWRQGPARQRQLPAGGDTAVPAVNDTSSAQPGATAPSDQPSSFDFDLIGGNTVQPESAPTVEMTRHGQAITYVVKGSDAVRVQAELTGNCWVSVVADGQEVYRGTLRAGDQPTWEARQRLEVHAGLPASLRLNVNGVAVDPIDTTEPMNLSFQIGA